MRLSVVIAVPEAGVPPDRCAESLLEQERPMGIELEVITVRGTAAADPPVRQTTAVFDPGASSLPLLLEAGLLRSSGDWVAITEAHCTFAPGWLAGAARAIARLSSDPAVAAIGGAVEPGGDLRRPIDLALYFCDYIAFAPPLAEGRSPSLPGNNAIFRRDALRRFDVLPPGFWKTFHCVELEKSGKSLLLERSMVVRYHRTIAPRALIARRLAHGRCFGAMRAARTTVARRLLYAAAAPAIPLLLLWRLIVDASSKRALRMRFLRAFPWSIACVTAWAAGEWFGNLFGAGRSCQRI